MTSVANATLTDLIIQHGQAAQDAARHLAEAGDEAVRQAVAAMAGNLADAQDAILAANERDVEQATATGLPAALVDRLRLDGARVAAMAKQVAELAAAPVPTRAAPLRDLGDGFRLEERRRPVGVIGATFEARPNVVLDIAGQLLRAGSAAVLRTGSAAITSSAAIVDHVIAPALDKAGLPAHAVQLIRVPGREAAYELVRHPALIPLVIIRGSGDTTRALASEAAQHGVRTLAHADGGGVLYVHREAAPDTVSRLLAESLDRLGVCNRLNLLLVDRELAGTDVWTLIHDRLAALGVAAESESDARPLGHEWANDDGHEATVTVHVVDGAAEAAAIANRETSGLAASIATEDAAAAEAFLDAYRGTGAFWNTTTRRLDGYRLLGLPETGINVDHVPGPRGPVTFHDLYLRQYVVVPSSV